MSLSCLWKIFVTLNHITRHRYFVKRKEPLSHIYCEKKRRKMSAGSRKTNGDEVADNTEGEVAGSAMADGGPGLAYMPFVVMEDLLDKLKLLNYEEVNVFFINSM